MNPDVHHLEPGNLGLVAHKMKLYEFNGWTRKQVSEPSGDSVWSLTHHIPHGTLVLILSFHRMNCAIHGDPNFYQILWDETCLFVARSLVYNPYVDCRKS